MKNKILMIAALFAVMVAMIGTATALQLNIYEGSPNQDQLASDSFNIAKGDTVKFSLLVSGYQTGDTGAEITPTVTCIPNTCSTDPAKILVVFIPTNPLLKTCVGACNQKYVDASEVTLPILNDDPIGQEYYIYYEALATPVKIKKASASNTGTNIPEFPTVALPVAGAIGLVFLLGNRKKKEE